MTRAPVLIIVLAVASASTDWAQSKPGEPLPFETLKDAHDRQRADDYRQQNNSRSLLQNERPAALGDSRVMPTPGGGYTTQPGPKRQ